MYIETKNNDVVTRVVMKKVISALQCCDLEDT